MSGRPRCRAGCTGFGQAPGQNQTRPWRKPITGHSRRTGIQNDNPPATIVFWGRKTPSVLHFANLIPHPCQTWVHRHYERPKPDRITPCFTFSSGPFDRDGLGPLPSGSETYEVKELPLATNMSSLCNPLQSAPFSAFAGGDHPGVCWRLQPYGSLPITNKKSSSISFLLPLPTNVMLIFIPFNYPLAISLFNPPFVRFAFYDSGSPAPKGGNSQNR